MTSASQKKACIFGRIRVGGGGGGLRKPKGPPHTQKAFHSTVSQVDLIDWQCLILSKKHLSTTHESKPTTSKSKHNEGPAYNILNSMQKAV